MKMTPLHVAADSVRAFVDAVDSNNRTSLHDAAVQGHVEATGVLIDGKATLDVPDCFHETPLHYAARNGHSAII